MPTKSVPFDIPINNLADKIEEQADRLFPHRTDAAMFLKLFGELGELVTSRSEAELADVLILLLDFGARRGFDIKGAVVAKMKINDNRIWGFGPDGVAQHVD